MLRFRGRIYKAKTFSSDQRRYSFDIKQRRKTTTTFVDFKYKYTFFIIGLIAQTQEIERKTKYLIYYAYTIIYTYYKTVQSLFSKNCVVI